ncbi:hypothetical protein GCM10017752_43340 [Streptomyces roseoviridis]
MVTGAGGLMSFEQEWAAERSAAADRVGVRLNQLPTVRSPAVSLATKRRYGGEGTDPGGSRRVMSRYDRGRSMCESPLIVA